MAIEKFWLVAGPVSLTGAGTTLGDITVTSTSGFKVKQRAFLTDPVAPKQLVQIKRVTSPTTMEVGPVDGSIKDRIDTSAYSATSSISALEQPRSTIPLKDIDRATYEEEPTVARRVVLVDEFGNFYTSSNPLPVDATLTVPGGLDVNIHDESGAAFTPSNPLPVQLADGSVNIGTVNAELEVQLSHQDNVPDAGDVADSVQIGDGTRTALISALQELTTSDILNNGFSDSVINVAGGGTAELKVGASRKVSRKMVFFKPLEKNIAFGGGSGSQSFSMAKDQFFFIPAGDTTEVWFKNNGVAAANIEIGEF